MSAVFIKDGVGLRSKRQSQLGRVCCWQRLMERPDAAIVAGDTDAMPPQRNRRVQRGTRSSCRV